MKTVRLKAMRSRCQRGAVAIMFGLTLVVLIGFAGLAIDLGRFFVIKTELQNAMDACALSAASQLKPGASDPKALTRAEAYGKVFIPGGYTGSNGGNAIKNSVNFQSMPLNPSVLKITFAETNNETPFSTTDSNKAKFVKCEYPLANLPIYFMRVLNPLLTTQTVSAMAVATRDAPTASCIPVALCTDNDAGTGYNRGDWISVVGDKAGPGFFGWVDFDPSGGGANIVDDILKGSRTCDVINDEGPIKLEPGNMAGVDGPWNSRFGWYDKLSKTTAAPDKTGFAYSNAPASPPYPAGNWPSGFNAYSGTPSTTELPNYQDARTAFKPYQGNQPPGIEDAPGVKNKYSPITSADHQAYGRADRRIAVAPIVNCTKWTDPGGPSVLLPILKWGCVLMLNPYINAGAKANYQTAKVEFLGLAGDVDSPCSGGSGNAFAPVLTQ